MNIRYGLSKYAFCTLLLYSASLTSVAQEDSPRREDAVGREYQKRGQAVLEMAASRMISALSAEERAKLGRLTVDVIESRDPLRVQLERESPESSRFAVSVGFLILQDVLVDASAVAVVSGKEAELIDYSVETARFALQANYPPKYRNAEIARTKPFWQHIGWTEEQYAAFRRDPRAKKLISQAAIQTHAWIIAYSVADCLNASDDSDELLYAASDLMDRAQFAPVPALGAAVLFFATKYPDEQERATWICGVRGSLLAAIRINERHRNAALGPPAETIDARIALWRRTAALLDERGDCAG